MEVSTQAVYDFEKSGRADPSQAVTSILVADCGSSFTRASLLQRTEAGYCFIAHAMVPTTTEPPWSDVSVGVRHAVEQITEIIVRPLLDENGMLIVPEAGGSGVDLFIVTASTGQPLQVVLAGLVSHVSLASLERAAASSYVRVVGIISRDYIGVPLGLVDNAKEIIESSDRVDLPDRIHALSERSFPRDNPLRNGGRVALGRSDEAKVAMIRQQHPDVVWVAGGTDGGSSESVHDLAETVALACTLVDRPPRPIIVYAGNAELRSEIVELVGQEVELEVVDNVRPSLDAENLAMAQASFQAAYVQRKLQRVPGMGSLIGWSGAPVLSTAQALGHLVVYLERLYESGKGVLCVDVGSATTSVAASFPPGLGSSEVLKENSRLVLQVFTETGVGYGAPSLLERVGVNAITRWLPFAPDPGEVEAVLLNKGLRPISIPQDRRQLLIEQAVAREALRLAMSGARDRWRLSLSKKDRHSQKYLTPPLEPIIATGGILSSAPRPGQTALMLLDTVEPVGITTFVLDQFGIAAALGAVAVNQPLAAVQALDAGPFLTLGTVVAPIGHARQGEVIMRVKITFDRGGTLEVEVRYGSLEILPLRIDEKAQLEFNLRRGISLGRVKGAVEVNGGAIGLIIDARGRPLRLPYSLDACQQQMQRWLWDMGA